MKPPVSRAPSAVCLTAVRPSPARLPRGAVKLSDKIKTIYKQTGKHLDSWEHYDYNKTEGKQTESGKRRTRARRQTGLRTHPKAGPRGTFEKEYPHMKKKIAVIGYGGMGGWHTEHLLKSDGCRACRYITTSGRKTRARREPRNKGHTPRARSFLADRDIEIVTIASRTTLTRRSVWRAWRGQERYHGESRSRSRLNPSTGSSPRRRSTV